jgi:hypothetical protein
MLRRHPDGDQREPPEPGQINDAGREIAQPLADWARFDRGLLLKEEVTARSEAADQFLRESLDYAKRSLDAAHKAVTEQAATVPMSEGHEARTREAAVRETIRALARDADWLKLLAGTELRADETLRQAVRALAKSVEALKPCDPVSAATPDFGALLAAIEFLQAEVARAMAAAGTDLPRQYLRDLLRTARRVSTQTALAIIAASVQSDLQGTKFIPGVIFTGLGAAVANSVAELFAAVTHKTRSVTPAAQMKQLHRQLISAVRDLRDMVPWLEAARFLPEVNDSVDKVRLGTVFLVSDLDQLAIRLLKVGRKGYRDLLEEVRDWLDDVQLLVAGRARVPAADICARLLDIGARLEDRSGLIDGL